MTLPTPQKRTRRAPSAPFPSDQASVDAVHQAVDTTSLSGQEGALAHQLARLATNWGLHAHIDDAGNFQAWTTPHEHRSAALPTVMMVGHLDTVPGGPPTCFDGTTLHGRGSVDAKGPLLAMLAATARYASSGDDSLVVGVIGAVEEETPESRGAVWLREHIAPPNALIIGEPSGWNAVTLGYKGKLDLRYTVTTPAAHPAHPGIKASALLVDFCAALLSRFDSAGNDRFDDVSLAITKIQADCAHAVCEFSMRTPIGSDLDELINWAECLGGPDGQVGVVNAIPAVRVRRSDPVVSALSAAIAQTGTRARHLVKSGTSDMNTLATLWDIPMASYGPGDAALDHGDDEHLLIKDYLNSIGVLVHALRRLDLRLSDNTSPLGTTAHSPRTLEDTRG